LRARRDHTGQVTVPVLWDKQRETIVKNDSSEIVRMCNCAFGAASSCGLDPFPAELQVAFDAVSDRPYNRLNNTVLPSWVRDCAGRL